MWKVSGVSLGGGLRPSSGGPSSESSLPGGNGLRPLEGGGASDGAPDGGSLSHASGCSSGPLYAPALVFSMLLCPATI